MGLIGALVKGAVAKRLFDAARRPHNQQRAKDLFGRATGNRGGRGSRPGAGGYGTPRR